MKYEKATAFGQMVEYFMLERDLTQSTLADMIAFSQPSISLAMNGKRRPSVQMAELLIEALEVPDEQQAEFLLLASGHSKRVIDKVLIRAKVKGPREI